MDTILIFNKLDGELFMLINNLPHNFWLNQLFLFFSFSPLVVWLFLGVLAILYEEKKDIWFGVTLLMALGLAGFMASILIKPLVARPRPDIAYKEKVVIVSEKPAVLPWNNDYAFPSGHAALAFAGAYILSREEKAKSKHKRLKKYYPFLFYGIAFLTAFSRIYLGKHYPLDVIVGAGLGLFMSFTAWKLVDLVKPKPVY